MADDHDAVDWLDTELRLQHIYIARDKKREEELRTLDARERAGETLPWWDQRQLHAWRTGPNHDTEHTVSLPLRIAELLRQCAERGMHRGHGRGGVRQWGADKRLKQNAVACARRCKREIVREHGESAVNAELQAAAEESNRLKRQHGLSLKASTIRRAMQNRAD